MTNRLDIATQAVLAAGQEILRHDPSTVELQEKSTAADFVTAADLASEAVIMRLIHENFPDDLVISEETKESHQFLNPENLSQLTGWVTDPIDGTNNFKKGMAYSGISLGYIENGRIMIGAVYDPFREELIIAERGKGATRNGQPIHVSDATSFGPGVRVCTSNCYEEGGTQANLDKFSKLGHVWADVLGSAVLIMTDVAGGRLDIFFHCGLKPWDNAAAHLIAEEAGAKLTDLSGKPITWLSNEVVVGNPALVDEFISRTTR